MPKEFYKTSKKLLTNFTSAISRMDAKTSVVGLMMLSACASPTDRFQTRLPRSAPPDIKLEMEEVFSLRDMIRDMNKNHDLPPSVRFQALSGLSRKALLFAASMDFFIDTYPSTGMKLVDSLNEDLKRSPREVSSLIAMENHYYPYYSMGLVQLSTRFGKFGDLAASLEPETFEKTLRTFLTYKDRANFRLSLTNTNLELLGFLLDISQQVALKGSVENKKNFTHLMTELYEDPRGQENNPSRKILGLALSTFYAVDHNIPKTGTAYEISKNYPLPEIPVLATNDLFQNGLHVSTVSFVDDTDGINHFGAFIGEVKRAKSWNLTDAGNFLKIEKAFATSGKNILILVAKPSPDGENFGDIVRYLAQQGLTPNSHMERGHSYNMKTDHLQKTDQKMVVFWGGCNSYAATKSIMEIAPNAYLVSTKEMGKGDTNNKLYLAFLDHLVKAPDLRFDAIWEEARRQGAALEGYLKPEDNKVALTYKKLARTQP